jgi:SAM-dependent methyltransferase
MELFGAALQVEDFPILKGLRVVGMTDPLSCAKLLAEKFDYKNTFYDHEPKLDITDITGQQEGSLDFLISSEVLEHVNPPLVSALRNAFRLLRPSGVLLLSVPYAISPELSSKEHFPQLNDYGVAALSGGPVLVNRTAQGEIQVFENLTFHRASEPVLEMRLLTETELRRSLLEAGFTDLRFYGEEHPDFGIRHLIPMSFPVAARKQPLVFDQRIRVDLMNQFARMHAELRHLRRRDAQFEARLEEAESVLKFRENESVETWTLVEQRTAWAQGIQEELQSERNRAAELESELARRTEWARDLERGLEASQLLATGLEQELQSRTTWALDLDHQLQERAKWASDLDSRVRRLEADLGNLRASLWNRLGRLLRFVR